MNPSNLSQREIDFLICLAFAGGLFLGIAIGLHS